MKVYKLGSAVVMVALMTAASGCGVVGGSGSDAGPASKLTDNFSLVAVKSGKQVVGHGISFVVPSSWQASEPEIDNTKQPGIREWAVEPTQKADPFAPYVDMSASASESDKGNVEDTVAGFKGLQSVNKDYKLLSEGDIHVPGSAKSHQLHFTYKTRGTVGEDTVARDLDIETRLILVSLPGGHVTTIRQIAPTGHFRDVDFDAILSSIRVHLG